MLLPPRHRPSGTTYLKNTDCDQPSAPTGAFTATGWQ